MKTGTWKRTYRILVTDSDRAEADLLKTYLDSGGYETDLVFDEESALKELKIQGYDLIMLASGGSDFDALSLTRRLREISTLPIVLLLDRGDENSLILGLNLGADEVLLRPCQPLTMLAKLHALLRRCYEMEISDEEKAAQAAMVTIGELTLNTDLLTLTKNGENIQLTMIEFRILSLLMRNPGRIFTKSDLCEMINGYLYDNYENAIMVHISHLRDKIEEDPRRPKYIRNIRGMGYKIDKK